MIPCSSRAQRRARVRQAAPAFSSAGLPLSTCGSSAWHRVPCRWPGTATEGGAAGQGWLIVSAQLPNTAPIFLSYLSAYLSVPGGAGRRAGLARFSEDVAAVPDKVRRGPLPSTDGLPFLRPLPL